MVEEYYESILHNDNLSVKEKLKTIYEQHIEIQKENDFHFKSTKEAILNDYLRCPMCEDYYKKSSFKYSVGTEIVKRCTNSLTGGYLDAYEYEDVEECFKYAICPKGHKFKVMSIY